jgi:hypothetical protein
MFSEISWNGSCWDYPQIKGVPLPVSSFRHS